MNMTCDSDSLCQECERSFQDHLAHVLPFDWSDSYTKCCGVKPDLPVGRGASM